MVLAYDQSAHVKDLLRRESRFDLPQSEARSPGFEMSVAPLEIPKTDDPEAADQFIAGKYDVIHCHPIEIVLKRFAARELV
jgi:hypothetical protein